MAALHIVDERLKDLYSCFARDLHKALQIYSMSKSCISARAARVLVFLNPIPKRDMPCKLHAKKDSTVGLP